MASMKDVAGMAGVSISTVSRVINSSLPVEQATRAKVNAAIEAIGYKPNLLARGLRVKSANLIGMLVPEIRSTSFSTLIEYVEERVEALGYNLILGGTGNDPNREERFFENLVRRHIDGVIISCVSDKSQVFRIIDNARLPVVIVDRPVRRKDMPTVVLDNFKSGVLAAEHLLSLGHTHFACITGSRDITIVRERFRGFRETIIAGGGKLDDAAVVEGNFKYDSGGPGVDQLLDRKVRFTALWVHNDIMAIGALNRLRERGLAVPNDVSVMGIDNVADSWTARPALTTIAQPYKEIADSAVNMIVSLSRGETVEKNLVILPPSLVVRDTTGIPGC